MCLAVPGEVLSIDDDALRTARVRFGGIVKQASLAYVPEAQPGDFVLVHVGFAITRVREDEAREVFRYLQEIEALDLP